MNSVLNSTWPMGEASSGVELTAKGLAYAERHLATRVRLERIVETALTMLDEIDGDPDLEPYLAGFDDATDDREGSTDNDECDGGVDTEPSLGWTEIEGAFGCAPTGLEIDVEHDILSEPHDDYDQDLEPDHDGPGVPWGGGHHL
ncbi:hypothetical protein EMQ25_05600 [Arsenicitalea aurantiaca]|uniref:Uncharacterized protein n=1 Tax=Arsenicitalea aurantiaca TaxID=1783274 RepID=A0A433XEV7_9HYPH|nr:hypothetical protein [Arsenicitalea aurantiaca]RUT32623.1 hypothetical protein EMQ25_05600 [Arsenicitalea aurantiaca]